MAGPVTARRASALAALGAVAATALVLTACAPPDGLSPDGFAPASVNILVQGEVLARIEVPASGALVSIPLPPGLQSLPPHVAIEYQAIDVAGNVGGVRPLAIAVAAAV